MEDRARDLLIRVQRTFKLYDDDRLTDFQRGELSGIQQAVSWLLEPDDWMEPITAVGITQEA